MSAPLVDTAEIPRQRPAAGGPVAHRLSPPVATVAPAPPAPRVATPAPAVPWVPLNPAPTLLPPPEAVPPIAANPSPPGRAALRAERLAARRERRLYACLGLGAIAGMLGATIVVLDVFH
jgi:hypothetical protein